MVNKLRWGLFVTCLAHPFVALVQTPDSLYRGGTLTDTVPAHFSELPTPQDSLIMVTYPVMAPWQSHPFPTPSLDHMRRYDPLDQPDGQEYAKLHNLGAASKAITPTLPSAIGFQAGLHAFRPYILPADSMMFIRSLSAFSDVYYAQGPTSEDGVFKGTFARRFGKGTDFYIEALRIYHIGEYDRLANHHSSLRTGLRYVLPNGKYSASFVHGNHIIDQEESGGIRTDTLLGDANYQERVNIPVWLSNAKFRYRETDYQVIQSLALRGKVDRDSLGRFILQHRFRWQDRKIKYSDTAPGDTTGFYDIFLTDTRGLRQYTTWSTLSNLVEAIFSWKGKQGGGILMQAGLDHRYHSWWNELHRGKVPNLMAVASTTLRWRKVADIYGSFQADVGDQAGTYRAEGRILLNLGNWAKLNGGIILTRRHPDLFEERLVVSQRSVYQFQWKPIQQQSIYGNFDLPRFKLQAGIHIALLTDPLYFQESGIPAQLSGTYGQSHIWVGHHLKLGSFHAQQRVSWQKSSDQRFPFPEWITRHDIYYEGLWFRKSLRTRIGTELRFISPWSPYGYMPIHGAFTIQDKQDEPWFPQIDGYISMERLGFRFFLELENAGQLIFGWKSTAENGASIPRVFSTVAGYPMPENWLRFGLAFTLRN